MGKLKPDRKPACSAKSIDRIFAIVSENWDEVWAVVQSRAQATKAINRQQLRNLRSKSFTH
jgi:hypothetical protein